MDKIGIQFNVWVIVLSFALAATTAYSALNLISQASGSTGKVRRLWLISGVCVLGSGVWALHYVGIMAMMENDVVLLMGVLLITLLMLAISRGAVFLERHMFERMAHQDSLTELPNRHGLERYFENEFFRSRSGAVFFVDLDRFKSINDTLGHDIGDMLLQEVAERLVCSISDRGKVFRLGGDEFLIALPDCTLEDAKLEAERIMHELRQFYHIQGNELYVTASVGISMTP
jgi:diguanylate cyclase (GGDEF)-like protein